jgi:uncharacterized membrane protein (DUF2068 family)
MRRTLRSVAVLEGTKGVLALVSLIGLLSLLHHDLHHLALVWMGYWGLDPTRPYPELLLHSVDALNAWSPNTLTLFALGYAAVRFAEAYGLWWEQAWGEWLGAVSCGVYVPFEVRHILHRPGWPGVLILLVNLAILGLLVAELVKRRQPGP